MSLIDEKLLLEKATIFISNNSFIYFILDVARSAPISGAKLDAANEVAAKLRFLGPGVNEDASKLDAVSEDAAKLDA